MSNNSPKLLILTADDVLFPAGDFYLQVYYLFSHFIEYTIQLPAGETLPFFKNYFHAHSDEYIQQPHAATIAAFNAAAQPFPSLLPYKANYLYLHGNCNLPLPIELLPSAVSLLSQAAEHFCPVALVLLQPVPLEVNRLKQINWQGFSNAVSVYYAAEFPGTEETLQYIIKQHTVTAEKITVVTNVTLLKKTCSSLSIKV